MMTPLNGTTQSDTETATTAAKREDTHYVKAMIQGAVVGVEEKLVGSMQAQTTRLIMKHCQAGAQGKPFMQQLGMKRRERGLRTQTNSFRKTRPRFAPGAT